MGSDSYYLFLMANMLDKVQLGEKIGSTFYISDENLTIIDYLLLLISGIYIRCVIQYFWLIVGDSCWKRGQQIGEP